MQSTAGEKTAHGDDNNNNDALLDFANHVSRECITCDGEDCTATGPKYRCLRCRTVYYCSVQCQKKHWKLHKPDCHDINTMRERLSSFHSMGTDSRESSSSSSLPLALNQECAICLSDPIRDPFLLECRHAFCFDCLQKYKEFGTTRVNTTAARLQPSDPDTNHNASSSSSSSSSRFLPCPLCREPHDEDFALARVTLLAAAASKRKDHTDQARQELHEEAIQILDKILNVNPNDFQALCKRASLMVQIDPSQAVHDLRDLLQKSDAASERRKPLKTTMERVEQAMAAGDDDLAERLLEEIENSGLLGITTLHQESRVEMQLLLAEAHEKLEDWKDALNTYRSIQQDGLDLMSGPPVQIRRLLMGMSKAFYEIGEYERSIAAGEMAISMNRHFPQVHKYVALSYKASGDLAKAQTCMHQAVLYETPWDEKNRAEAYKLWRELEEEEAS